MTRESVAGRRVLLTGAAGGIGAATAAELRRRGARVAGLDLVAGPEVLACDVTDCEAVGTAVTAALEQLGGLDVLINNAGIGDAHNAGAAPDDRARATLDVNFWGTWQVTAAALPALLESRGRVVNVASGLAVLNVPLAVAYLASKRAVAAYSDSLRLEYGHRIGVTTVYPGLIRTAIHDRSAASGVSLLGMLPEESVDTAVRTLVAACTGRPRRDRATSLQLAAAMRVARVAPGVVDSLVAARVRRHVKGGGFHDAPIAAHLLPTTRGR